MVGYDPRPELMATQQSLLKECEHQLSKKWRRIWQYWAISYNRSSLWKTATPGNLADPGTGKTKCFQNGYTKNFNEELLSVAEE